MNATELAQRLETVLKQVWSIRPDWQHPERFHEARSEATASLKSLIAEASQLKNGAPAVATKARAALRLLETSEAPSSPEPVSAPPGPAVTAPAAVLESPIEIDAKADSLTDPTLSPIVETGPVQVPDLAVLQQSIAATVSMIARILGDVEKLALAASAAYTSALMLPPQIVPPQVPAAPFSTTRPASTDPHTLYRRSYLLTDEGRAIAASLWADGLSRSDIAKCFDYVDSSGPACVSAAIVTFLRLHYPAQTWTVAGDAGKDLVRQALLATGYTPGQKSDGDVVSPMPASPAHRANGDTARPPPPQQADTPTRSRLPTVPALPALSPGHFQRSDLRTDAGQAQAAELWLQGYGQHAISRHFGYERHGAPYVSLAIAAFLDTYGSARGLAQCGESRKPFVREALRQLRATTADRSSHPQQASGDVHVAE